MMKNIILSLLLLLLVSFTTVSILQQGQPWNGKPQLVPGRIECEWYDKGGEGIAYHDADSINNGSGKLNPANGDFLNEFRMHEGTDISYTKAGGIDDNPFNKVNPALHQLYLGWTQSGEWTKYTVQVNETASYKLGVMYTSNAGGVVGLDVDGKQAATQLKISSTYDARDTVAWRQWHHWNKLDSLTSIKMRKGIHVLTLHIVETGNMNFDYLEFTKE